MEGAFVLCFFVGAHSPLLPDASRAFFRLRDLFSLLPDGPAVLPPEPKYDSMGSSPDIDGRGPMAFGGQRMRFSASDLGLLTRLDYITGDSGWKTSRRGNYIGATYALRLPPTTATTSDYPPDEELVMGQPQLQ